MYLRAIVVWFGLLGLAALNGALRDLVVAPRFGDPLARALSTVILCALILLVARYTVRWIGPRRGRDALAIGALWSVITLVFEFGSGLYAGKTWAVMLEDYDLLRGRLWVVVPIVTFLAPLWAGLQRRRWAGGIYRRSTQGDSEDSFTAPSRPVASGVRDLSHRYLSHR